MELATLDALLAQACNRVPTVVVVEGAAGMGKTTLVRRFLDGAEMGRLFQASGDEVERRLPYGVLAQLVDGLGADQDSAYTDPLSMGARFLGAVGGESDGPLVVVVDDAHWADVPSLQALTFALRRLQADPVLAVFLARDDGPPLPESLERLVGDRRLRVGGLDAPQISALARGMGTEGLSPQAAGRLRDHTGGNPLHVRALLDELGPEALRRRDGLLPAPRSFSLLVNQRVAACSAPARRLVEAAAVLGAPSPLTLVARLAEIDDPVGALDESVSASLLAAPEPVTVPDVAFPHPLVRAAVYHDLRPRRRSALHARAGTLLDGPAALEHLVAAALVHDVALAAKMVALARAESADGALGPAAGHLLAAARLSPERATRENLVLDAVELLLGMGDLAEVRAMAVEVATFAISARKQYLLGQLAFFDGRHGDAEQLLLKAWGSADPELDRELAAHICSYLAWLYSVQMRLDDVIRWARQGLNTGDLPDLRAPALSLVLTSLGLAGRAEEALALAGADPGPESGEVLTLRRTERLLGRGVVRMWADQVPEARADLSAAAASPRLSGMAIVALGWLAEAEYRAGAWDDSIVHGELAVSLGTDTDQVWLSAFLHTMATWVLSARGDWPQAEGHVKAADRTASAVGDEASLGYAAMAAVHLAFCRADPYGVVEGVGRLLSLPSWRQVHEPGVMAWPSLYAGALVSLGRTTEAEDVLDALEAQAGPRRRRSVEARGAGVRGALAAARGDEDGARSAFDAALRYHDGLSMPFERALLEDAYGRFLRRIGARRDAVALLGAALDTFNALAASPFADRARTELAACGVSAVRRSTATGNRLTPQELSVARLVGDGLSNRDVAAQLVVSVKTVEYHLTHVYAKLGLASRTQLAAQLGRAGGHFEG